MGEGNGVCDVSAPLFRRHHYGATDSAPTVWAPGLYGAALFDANPFGAGRFGDEQEKINLFFNMNIVL